MKINDIRSCSYASDVMNYGYFVMSTEMEIYGRDKYYQKMSEGGDIPTRIY